MANTKKMAVIGLYLMVIGPVVTAFGVYLYNTNKDKSGSEKHTEIINNQEQIGDKIKNAENSITSKIDSLKSQKQEREISPSNNPGKVESSGNSKQHYVGRDNYGINGDVTINREKEFGKSEQDLLISMINENKQKYNVTSNIAIVNLYSSSSDKVFRQIIAFLSSNGYEVGTNMIIGGGAPKGIVVQVSDNKTIINIGDL